MRINIFNANLINYKQNKKPYLGTQNHLDKYTPNVSYDKTPSIAFTGFIFNRSVEKIKLPKVLKNIKGEIYQIKLFDKTKKQEVNAFIGYERPTYVHGTQPESEKALSLYNEEGNKIGGVNLNFTDWKFFSASTFKHGLPVGYTRLHHLKNISKEHYKKIGSILIQASVEKSLQTEAKGRLYLCANNFIDSENDPFIFYNKMRLSIVNPYNEPPKVSPYLHIATEKLDLPGVRSLIELIKGKGKNFENLSADEQILTIYETYSHNKPCEIDEINLEFNEFMYLHEDKVKDFWLPKIKENPIFSDNNRLK